MKFSKVFTAACLFVAGTAAQATTQQQQPHQEFNLTALNGTCK